MTITGTPTFRSCVRCGYDLRGLAAARCPECGLPFDPNAPPPPAVPWVRRAELGIVSAYAQTVAMVVLRPRKFAEQAWRWTDVDPTDAERFRRVTVALAALSIGVLAGTAGLINDWDLRASIRLSSYVGLAFIVFVGTLTFLSIATLRVPIRFPLAREGFESRFAALQKYCCAGLALSVFICLSGIAAAIMVRMNQLGELGAIAFAVYLASIVATLIAWMAGCGMYLAFGGHVDAKTWFVAIIKSAGLWAIAIFATVVVCVSLGAVVNFFG